MSSSVIAKEALVCTNMSAFLCCLPHLCGPELHQYSPVLHLHIGPIFLQKLPVGMQPRAGPRIVSQTCWSQKLPEFVLNTLSCLLLLCYTHINIIKWVSEPRMLPNINRWGHSKCHWARCQTKICYCIHAQRYAIIFELAVFAIVVMGGTDGIVHNKEGQVPRRRALCCDNELSAEWHRSLHMWWRSL